MLAAVKNWFAPTSHEINKQWAGRNRAGWTSADRVQCEACRKWRRLPEGMDGWPRDFYCEHAKLWDPRRASCDAPEEEWQRDLPTTGDIIVYQVAQNQWLQGRVHQVPQKRTRHEAYTAVDETAPDAFTARATEGPRRRKPVERFEAASCTAYTKDLRRVEKEDEVRRLSLRMVVFTDGETRCVPFTAETCWRDWTFAWQWEARKAALLAKPEPQQRAAPPVAGRRLFFKVDGRAWREVELQRQCTAAQWERLQAHLEQQQQQEEDDGVAGSSAPSPDGSDRGADGAPADPPRKGGGDGQGKGSKALRRTEKEKPKATGAAAKGAAAKAAAAAAAQQQQQQEEGRGGWWQARCVAVPGQPVSDAVTPTLLIRVTAATQWEQWAPEAGGGEGGERGKGGEGKAGTGKKRKTPLGLQAECPNGEILKVLGVRGRGRGRGRGDT